MFSGQNVIFWAGTGRRSNQEKCNTLAAHTQHFVVFFAAEHAAENENINPNISECFISNGRVNTVVFENRNQKYFQKTWPQRNHKHMTSHRSCGTTKRMVFAQLL